MTSLVGLSVTSVQNKVCQQVLDEFGHNFVQTFIVPEGCTPVSFGKESEMSPKKKEGG